LNTLLLLVEVAVDATIIQHRAQEVLAEVVLVVLDLEL
jgi:hypothetical protein